MDRRYILILVILKALLDSCTSDDAEANSPAVEFRAVWMATVHNMDWPSSPTLPAHAQQEELRNYVDLFAQLHLNAIFFHARPAGDALYRSNVEPWSAFLTGKQGLAPSPIWDPLEFLIAHAHQRGIKVYAWLNPFRANLQPNWDGLAPNHMAMKYRQYAYPYDTFLWMDPGAAEIQNQFRLVVDDIITRYDVDGVHIDDYFYPYPRGGQAFPDNGTYSRYLAQGGSLALDDWRRQNINDLVQSTYSQIKRVDASLNFSVSPTGMYRTGEPGGMPPPLSGFDPYSKIYADTKRWLQEGWMDMFVPQLYQRTHDPISTSYILTLDWWLSVNAKDVVLCAGNAIYELSPDAEDWPVREIKEQIEVSRSTMNRQRYSLGNVLFRAGTLRDNVKGVADLLAQDLYEQKAVVP